MDDERPIDLLRNLRGLIELDRWFGVEVLPRIEDASEAQPEVRKPGRVELAVAATVSTATVSTATEAPAPPLPDPVADIATDLPAADQLAAIAGRIEACARCGLCATRGRVVPGEGAVQPEILFVGEGPGADEDRQGRPFVGAAGQLLDKMIRAMGFAREAVFITNVVKCRPPGNRNPEPAEIAACLPYLDRQIDALRPKIICTLGNVPLRALRGEGPGITRARGSAFDYRGYTVIPTFHPSYLLRNEAAKKPCWEDLQAVLAALGRSAPGRG